MGELSRRTFLKQTAMGGAALGMAATGIALPRSVAAQSGELKWAALSPGFTLIVTEFMQAKGFDKKLGLNLAKPINYSSVSTYYNDFVAGNYDICLGTWDTFAARYLANVPIQLVCNLTTAEMINIIVPGGGPKTLQEMEGKVLAAAQSTGTYRMARAIIKELTGIDLEKTMKVQNVDNPAAAVTLVLADRADAALSWEPNISMGLSKKPGMRVLYGPGNEYRKKTGRPLPFFSVAVRKEVAARPGVAEKIDRAFADCLNGIMANQAEALEIAGKSSGIDPSVLKLAMTSGRMSFIHESMREEKGRSTVIAAAEVLQRNGLLPRALDNAFFVA